MKGYILTVEEAHLLETADGEGMFVNKPVNIREIFERISKKVNEGLDEIHGST